MRVLLGFCVFVAVSCGARLGLDVVLDWWWTSQGLPAYSRPDPDAFVEWVISGGIGLAAGKLVTTVFGED